MKKKVIFFTPSRCGGAERVLVTISKCLPDSEYDVSYHLFGDINQMTSFIPPQRSTIWHIKKNHVDDFLPIARKVIKEEKPDVVFASQMPLNWRLALATLGHKVKLILRSNNYVYTQSLSQKIRLSIGYHLADVVIAQTEEMRQGIIKKLFVPPKKVITLPNPVDKEFIDCCMKKSSNPYFVDSINYVAVGRFVPAKGFDILIEAFAIVKSKQPNAILTIVGRYDDALDYFEEVKKIADSLGVIDSVKFEGFKENPYSYMKFADCYVLSSRNEGLPNVMLEALYLGTPVAATNCIPVIGRIIKDGVNGYLAQTENSKSLAEAMLKTSKLGRVSTGYYSSNTKDFIDLFN